MVFDEKELISRRLKLWEENKKLLALAESENRSYKFTAEEQEQFDKRNVEIDSITDQIKTGRASNRIDEEMKSYRPEDQIPHMGTILDDDERSSEVFRDANGHEVRLLKRGESLAQYRGGYESSGGRRTTAGDVIRDFVTGPAGGRRALSEGSATAGGLLLSPSVGATLIDLSRAKSVAFSAGAQLLPMDTSEVVLAKITSDPTVTWVGESETIPSSDPAIGSLNLHAKKMACIIRVSRELVNDAANAAKMINDLLSSVMAAELDRAVFLGDASPGPEPVGVLNDTSVQEIASVGSPVWSDFIDAQKLVRQANGEPTSMIFSPNTEATLAKLLINAEVNHAAVMPEALSGLTKFVTSRLDDTAAIVGDLKQVIVGVREAVEIRVSDAAGDGTDGAFANDELWVRATWRGDVGLLHGDHLCKLTGIV